MIDGPQDVAVTEYSAWQETIVVDENVKAQFRQTYDVMLADGIGPDWSYKPGKEASYHINI